MPTRSPVVKVHISSARGRTTYELTQVKIRALETVGEDGRLSDAVPFATARAMTRAGLLRQIGPSWFITELGKTVRHLVRVKLANSGV